MLFSRFLVFDGSMDSQTVENIDEFSYQRLTLDRIIS